jgi:hypothetical protein
MKGKGIFGRIVQRGKKLNTWVSCLK